jgi:cytochrome c-type biogenesis protein CcmH
VTASGSTSRARRAFPLWTAFALVVIVALVIGSGALSSAPPTPQQRATAIESDLRCPTCEDLSVAQSSAPTAVTVRETVSQMIAEGKTDQQIESFLVARYGGNIVLDPPGSGVTLLVWLLPLIGGVLAVGGVALVLVRRRSVGSTPDAPDRPLDERSRTDRRRFLEESLADADAEYMAGDLSDGDYLSLRRRDMAALVALGGTTAAPERPAPSEGSSIAVVDRPVPQSEGDDADGVGRPAGDPRHDAAEPHKRSRLRRPRRSGWFLAGAVVAFGAAVVLAAVVFAGNRLPGQPETGGVSLNQSQQVDETLAQAAVYENQGQLAKAAGLYQSVVTAHPDNEQALAQLGWLEVESGEQAGDTALVGEGQTKLTRAVALAPTDPAARLYLGTILLQDGNATGAVAQYRDFLADDPPSTLVHEAASDISQAYRDVGQPVPAAVSS